MPQNSPQSEQAKTFIKKNKKLLFEKFASVETYKPVENPVSLFMAGSPGAGKTEFSEALLEELSLPIARIDADEIRKIIPAYNGANSAIVQGGASIGVDILYNYVLKKKLSALLDGTFAKFEIVLRNIERSLAKGREVEIFYIYQEPLLAWEFTQKREKIEGRTVPKKAFIDAYFNSRKNVAKIKKLFKDKILVNIIIKNYKNKVEKSIFDVENIDDYLELKYTKETLNKQLK